MNNWLKSNHHPLRKLHLNYKNNKQVIFNRYNNNGGSDLVLIKFSNFCC